MLSRVLRLCAGTWEGDENSFSANILNGITRLVYTFGNQLNDEVFKERVGALSIKQLVRMSKERCPGSMGYAEAMLLEYNGKKKNISQRLSMNKLHMQEPLVYAACFLMLTLHPRQLLPRAYPNNATLPAAEVCPKM